MSTTLCRVSGYLFTATGNTVTQGELSFTLQQDMISVDGQKIAPFAATFSLEPLATPGQPTVSNVGTPGSTSYSYQITAVDYAGNETLAGTVGVTGTGNATLNGSNYNHLTWTAVPGAAQYRIYGRTGTLQRLATVSTTTYDDQGATPSGALPTANTTGGYLQIDLAPTVGASPSGLAYFVEYDPDPEDTTKPARQKDGYWSNYWSVPNTASVPIGSFTSALRGLASSSYLPLSSVMGTVADTLFLDPVAQNTTKIIKANTASSNKPAIRFNSSTSKWEVSDDGVTFYPATSRPVVLFSTITSVGSSHTGGATDVVTYTLPANTLNADGQMLQVFATFKHAGNTNSANAWMKIFGTILNGQSCTLSSGIVGVELNILRTSSSTASVWGWDHSNSTTNEDFSLTSLDFTVTNTIIQRIQNITADDDIKSQSLKVVWYPA